MKNCRVHPTHWLISTQFETEPAHLLLDVLGLLLLADLAIRLLLEGVADLRGAFPSKRSERSRRV